MVRLLAGFGIGQGSGKPGAEFATQAAISVAASPSASGARRAPGGGCEAQMGHLADAVSRGRRCEGFSKKKTCDLNPLPFPICLYERRRNAEKEEGSMTDSVLMVGATGHIGRHLVKALLGCGHEVLMLTRSRASRGPEDKRSMLIEAFMRQGAKRVEGSLEDAQSLERACAQADAVVSTIDHRPDHLKLQVALARDAAASGRIRRFIPSQFGMDSRTYGQGQVDHGDVKKALQREFDASGVPITYVHINGLATAWAASLGQLGLDSPPSDAIDVYGEGGIRFSMVTPEDVGQFAARTLFDPRTANRHVLISPPENRLSQNELIAIWEAKARTKLRRRLVSARELDDRLAALANRKDKFGELAFLQLIRAAWIDGLGDGRRRPDVLELTELYPDTAYETIPQYLERFVPAMEVAQ